MLPEKQNGAVVSKCWECANAVPHHGKGCSWSRSFIPVDGWEAVYDGDNATWFVLNCPQFKQDTGMKVSEYDGERLKELFLVVIREAGRDYLAELRRWLPEFRKWQREMTILSQFYGPKKTPPDNWRTEPDHWAKWTTLEIPSEIKKLELFFRSEKAEMMMDGEPQGIMSAVKKHALDECRK